MNPLKEINSFYDWLETNSISTSVIALWHALMHINNKAGWIPEFAVAMSVLEMKSGLKKGAIITARLKLQQLGRVDFKSRAGQQSAIYRIIPFHDYGTVDNSVNKVVDNFSDNSLCSFNERKPIHNTGTNQYTTQTQTDTQTSAINKLNKTKLKKNNIVACAGEVCPKCEGKGWFIAQEPFNNGLSMKDVHVTCDCAKDKKPSWAVNL